MADVYGLIMAGGVGSRFWPKSRKAYPKQYLQLLGDKTMIQATAERLSCISTFKSMFVVTAKDQGFIVHSQLKQIPENNIIKEPFGMNTAPCIGLAAVHIQAQNPDAVMIITPADHRIGDEKEYCSVLEHAVKLVGEKKNALVTIGIKPTYPSTGYGYIQQGEKLDCDHCRAFNVKAFAEKPTLDVAQQFFESQEFLWNSGMFIWRADTILENIKEFMPGLYSGLMEIKASIGTEKCDKVTESVYSSIYKESIDYGIMEKADNVFVIEGDFGWSDVGSWEEVYNISHKDTDGNVIKGHPIYKNVKNSYIETGDKTVALIGVEDLVVVDAGDALLITKRDDSQDVKWVVEKLKEINKNELL